MRITKYAIKNILRNKFLSISSLLVLTLLMFFINILVVVHDVSLKLIGEINSKLTISLYLDDKYDKNSIEVVKLFENIAKISKDIQVDYKDKQQSLEEIQVRDPDLAKILERTNPLPETITISNIALKQYEAVNAQVEGKMFLLSKNETDTQHFSSYSQQYEKIVGIIKILHLLQY